MRIILDTPAATLRECARRLEAACEGAVLSMISEAQCVPDGVYPCCIGCGELTTVSDGRSCKAQCELAEAVLEEAGRGGDPETPGTHVYGDICTPIVLKCSDGPSRHATSILRIRSLRQILESGGGSTLELACYQAAMKRFRGDDPAARVVVIACEDTGFRGVVLHSEHHEKPEKRGCMNDPVTLAPACDCEVLE